MEKLNNQNQQKTKSKTLQENKVDLVLNKWLHLQKIMKEEITLNEISI
jgi:hypothetical protein